MVLEGVKYWDGCSVTSKHANEEGREGKERERERSEDRRGKGKGKNDRFAVRRQVSRSPVLCSLQVQADEGAQKPK